MQRYAPLEVYVTKAENTLFRGGHYDESQEVRRLRDGIRRAVSQFWSWASLLLLGEVSAGCEQPALPSAPESTEVSRGIDARLRHLRRAVRGERPSAKSTYLLGEMQRSPHERDAKAGISGQTGSGEARMCGMRQRIYAEQVRNWPNNVLRGCVRESSASEKARPSGCQAI